MSKPHSDWFTAVSVALALSTTNFVMHNREIAAHERAFTNPSTDDPNLTNTAIEMVGRGSKEFQGAIRIILDIANADSTPTAANAAVRRDPHIRLKPKPYTV